MIIVSLQTPGRESKRTLMSRRETRLRERGEKIKKSKEDTKSDESPGPQFSYQSKP
jgi:hypothetical protein